MLGERLGLGDRRALLVDHQRGIDTDGAEWLGRLGDPLRQRGVDQLNSVAAEDRIRLLLALVVEDEVDARLGNPLAEHRLRGRHELNALLDAPLLDQQPLLFDGMLGVMAGVHLVPDEMNEVVTRRRDVGVEDDAARQVAEVVVERPPRLVRHRVDRRALARGELEQRSCSHAEDWQQLVQQGDCRVVGDEVPLAPGLTALVEAAVARQELVELGVHRAA